MKLDDHIIDTDKIELPAGEYSQSYVKQIIGKTNLHKGHTIFMINLVTGVMTIAKIAKTDIHIFKFGTDSLKEFKTNDEVEVPEDCIPVCALNKKNALKKFAKIAEKLYA